MKNTKMPLFALTISLIVIVNIFLLLFFSYRVISYILVFEFLILMIYVWVNLIYMMQYNKNAVNRFTTNIDMTLKNVTDNLPVAIIVLNSGGIISWINKAANEIFDVDIMNEYIDNLIDNFIIKFDETNEIVENIGQRTFKIQKVMETYYFFDITEQEKVSQKYIDRRLVLGYVNLDNYEDYTSRIDDHMASEVALELNKILNNWSMKHNSYLRKYSSEKYMIISDVKNLNQMIKENFSILDEIREYGEKANLPTTLSMSFVLSRDDIAEVGEMAQEALNVVMSRGGDQVIVRDDKGDNKFFGGKSEAVEKRTRVKVRMYAKSLQNLFTSSKKIFIMGHQHPDLDSIGACVGMASLAKNYNENVFCLLNRGDLNKSVQKLVNYLEEEEEIFTDSSEIMHEIDNKSLVIVVDTHRPSSVCFPEILDKAVNVIIVDHHRRGEEFIENALISYVEPYASSTSELITELITYQEEAAKMPLRVATALLSGIVLDTKNFVYRTGGRTFSAAAILKKFGADATVINNLLKDDITEVLIKNKIKSSLTLEDKVGIAFIDEVIEPYLLAQVADELLYISDVNCSFAIGKLKESVYYVSARSNGAVNVQIIMEQLGGGGHLTNAASKVSDTELEELIVKIKELVRGENHENNLS